MPFSGLSDNTAVVLAILAWNVCTTFVWLVVGWRAMRAHEKMADAVDELSRRRTAPENE